MYVVAPAAVVDTDEEEPEEYRPGRSLTPERIAAMRDSLHSVIQTYYRPIHPEIFHFNEVFSLLA